jgi:uncharacterized membrane protein
MLQKQHFLEEHDPERKDFQVDRIILFSDAVFAIAITLLVIEIKAPQIHQADSRSHQVQQLLELIPEFVAFLISFFVVAIYWRSHHRIFGFVGAYSSKLILVNSIFLFTIVLMPFSSAYFSENFGYVLPFIFYNTNIIITGIINYYFIRYVFNPQSQLVTHRPTPMFLHLFKARAITIPIFFIFVNVFVLFGFVPSPFVYLLIWPIFYILRKYNQRKYKSKPATKHFKHS